MVCLCAHQLPMINELENQKGSLKSEKVIKYSAEGSSSLKFSSLLCNNNMLAVSLTADL